MRFTRSKTITKLEDNKKYNGTIYDIIKTANGGYYDVKVKTKQGIISIWVKDEVNPEHPLFPIFDYYIENEEDAETFDEQEIVGTEIQFTVKNIAVTSSKGTVTEHSFFDKVTPVFEDEADDTAQEDEEDDDE